MRFTFNFDQGIFKLLSVSLVISAVTVALGVVSVMFMDYQYYKFKIENKRNNYVFNSNEKVET